MSNRNRLSFLFLKETKHPVYGFSSNSSSIFFSFGATRTDFITSVLLIFSI